jgi:lipopolysaccharide export system protein LptC
MLSIRVIEKLAIAITIVLLLPLSVIVLSQIWDSIDVLDVIICQKFIIAMIVVFLIVFFALMNINSQEALDKCEDKCEYTKDEIDQMESHERYKEESMYHHRNNK